MVSPDSITQDIAQQYRRTGTWRIPADRMPLLLGINATDFYQQLYLASNRPGGTIEAGTITRTFGPRCVGEFVDVLELFCPTAAEAALYELGVFLPHHDRIELSAHFFERVAADSRAHTIDFEAFHGMLRHLPDFERARDAYFKEFFPLGSLIERTVSDFVRGREFRVPDLAARTASEVLERMCRSRAMEISRLLFFIGDNLYGFAVERGYADSPHADSEQSSCKECVLEERLEWACEVMGVSANELNTPALKRRYKTLMLRYHPDVNPAGHRVAQQINSAYALLTEIRVRS